MTEKTREQIAEEYKWDLSTIYKNNEEFLKLLELYCSYKDDEPLRRF